MVVDSSPENQAEIVISGLKSRWSEIVRKKLVDQRRSMLKKLVGRLSQKVNPEPVDTVSAKPPAHTELRGCCDHTNRHNSGTAASFTSAGLTTSSSTCDPMIYDANQGLPSVCYYQRDSRATLTIYRSSLQSCADDVDPANDLTSSRDKPAENFYDKSNQVCDFLLGTCVYTIFTIRAVRAYIEI